ncbi:sodium/calcium exchanger NCL2-like [Bidens hawaiensis]|uniref:sodium/calcium exchanger NCL2-like n=1 Tax=Bidens hawaiensis TaxID=980011 RepID=UPI00404A77B1
MGKLFAKIALCSALIHFLLVGKVVSRHLQYNEAELVSDGVSNGRVDESILRLKGMDSSEEECKLMYGFLPCSTNIPSHIFLIVIYEYLLYHGESYAGGDGRIFRFLGKNFLVSCFSQLLDSLPDSLILLATGLSCSHEKAQDYVVTGAGLLAGSSILLLTLLWGTCFICGSQKFPDAETIAQKNIGNQAIQLLSGSGVLKDAETSYHAKFMFFSLIPFAIILLPSVFGLSYSSEEYKIVLFVSLSASLICLISYFYYQRNDSRIWKRRLEYAEVEQKVEMHVSFYEVQRLMLDREKYLMMRQKKIEEIFNNPETTSETMKKGEFYKKFEDWLDGTKKFLDGPRSLNEETEIEYNQVRELLLKDKNKLIDLMSLMMKKKLVNEDGILDDSAIERLFNDIDTDSNGYITPTELQTFIVKDLDKETMVVASEIQEIIMRHLDTDRNGNIDKREFRLGIKKWLSSRNLQMRPQDNMRVRNIMKEKKCP